jgi:hypothetical protein
MSYLQKNKSEFNLQPTSTFVFFIFRNNFIIESWSPF